MIQSDEILEKILYQSQMTGMVELIEDKEIIDNLKSYQVWSEMIFERYYQESKRNFALNIELLKEKERLNEAKKEIEMLKKQLSF